MAEIKLSLVVAMASNNVIGCDNALPWRLPEDLKHFKALTMGKPVIMGRKTYESIGRPLPGRPNIVVSQSGALAADESVQLYVCETLGAAIDCATGLALGLSVEEIMIIGGSQIYQAAMSIADCLYVTHVKKEVMGDAYFPEIKVSDWQKCDQKNLQATQADVVELEFATYLKVEKG